MFQEVQLIGPNADPYASVDDLIAVDDMVQADITVRRWGEKPLKLRVRGPSLDEQDAIHQAALMKNPKTGEWEEHRPTFCAETLQRCVIMPQLDVGQSKMMRKKNPVIINAITDIIWVLPTLGPDDLEKLALDLAPPNTDNAPALNAGDSEGTE